MITKPVNKWLYLIISLFPFVGYYPFLKLKKTRRIFLINLPIGIACLVVTILFNHVLGQFMTYLMLPTIDVIFLYKWIEEHNQKISNNSTP